MSLSDLATEVQCSIIRLLDPHGLISISQTNTHFRRLVDPQRKHFIERLLYLETLVEHGGVAPVIRARDNHIDPAWPDQRWEAMRWACCGCDRLLSHKHFDNHAILRLHVRKPLPEALPALQFTTWEPLEEKPAPKPELSGYEIDQARIREKRVRQRYYHCCTGGQGDTVGDRRAINALTNEFPDPRVLYQHFDMVGFEPYHDGYNWHWHTYTVEEGMKVLDANARTYEIERGSKKRKFRRCNECRYQENRAPREDGSGGNSELPIMTSRQVCFNLAVDRYFPGFTEFFNIERPPSPSSVPTPAPWVMRMARCPGCYRWQELRAFRCGGLYRKWAPVRACLAQGDTAHSMNWDGSEITESFLGGLRCNTCFAEAHGRSKLSQTLLAWLRRLIDDEMRMEYLRMRADWWSLSNSYAFLDIPRECRKAFKHIVHHTKFGPEPRDSGGPSAANVAILKTRRREWKVHWKQVKEQFDLTGEYDLDSHLDKWERDFGDSEVNFYFLESCLKVVEAKAEMLADWALSRDGSAFT